MENKLFFFSSKDVQEAQRHCANFAYCASVYCDQETEYSLESIFDYDFPDLLQMLSEKQIVIKLQFFDLIFSRFISYLSYYYALKDGNQIRLLFNALNSVYESHTKEQNLDFIQHQDIDVFVSYLEEIKTIFMAQEDNTGLLNKTLDIISSVYLQDIKQEFSLSDFDENLISYSFDSVITNADKLTYIQVLPATLDVIKSSFPHVSQIRGLEESSRIGMFMEKFCEQAIQLFYMATYDFNNMNASEILNLKKFWMYFMSTQSSGIYPKLLFDRCNELLGVNTKD